MNFLSLMFLPKYFYRFQSKFLGSNCIYFIIIDHPKDNIDRISFNFQFVNTIYFNCPCCMN